MAQIQLTQVQSEMIKRQIQEARLKALISYRSGRVEAEFVEPDSGVRERIDLTPEKPRQIPRAHRWTNVLLFGGLVWAGLWFIGGMMRFIDVAPIIIAINVTIGLVASIAGVVLAERQLGTPILLSPEQSSVLRRRLEEGAELDSVSGGGGTSVLGRGHLYVQFKEEEHLVRYAIGASGDVKRRTAPPPQSKTGGQI
ncbi:MAG: hypothetical protein R3248_12345 [Candidatus Promineifilaceae bacterium]|nr:hypothetical protein [Candidatus Promineifilaceae bacterium]